MSQDAKTGTNTGKPFNPTITAMFENPKFGEGSLLSATIDSQGFKVLQQQVTIGGKLLLRKSKKPASNGRPTYFLEFLPSLETNQPPRKSTGNTDSEI